MSQAVSLWEVFSQVPDPRDAQGRRHPLPAVLTLAAVAILSGARSLYAIAQFGRDRGKAFAAALGFTRDVPPCCTTLHYLFAALDRKVFERAIRRWTAGRVAGGWKSVSLDGKTLRGAQGEVLWGLGGRRIREVHDRQIDSGIARGEPETSALSSACGLLPRHDIGRRMNPAIMDQALGRLVRRVHGVEIKRLRGCHGQGILPRRKIDGDQRLSPVTTPGPGAVLLSS